MNESFFTKLLVIGLLAANYGCQSKHDGGQPPAEMTPSPENAPCYDGNGNKECTDEAKRVKENEQAEPVAKDAPAAPEAAPQAAIQVPEAPHAAVQVPVAPEATPQAAVETPAASKETAIETTPAPVAPVVLEESVSPAASQEQAAN